MNLKFDELLRSGKETCAGRYLANELYIGCKIGHSRKKLIEWLSDKVDEQTIELERLKVSKGKETDIKSLPCNYCKSIEKSTRNSPRRKYKFCPMCGRVRI